MSGVAAEIVQRIADELDALNEESRFLVSIRGEMGRDEWKARWRACQAARQELFIMQERLRSNPDRSLRQDIIADAINNSATVT